MFATIGRTWRLTRSSWQVLRQDKDLLLFPIASAIGVIALLAIFGAIGSATGSLDRIDAGLSGESSSESMTVADVILLVAMTVSTYFVGIFFNAALVSAALERLRGGDPSFKSGIRATLPYTHNILGWAIITASVGIILRALQERADNGFVRILIGMVGGVWAYLTFFVVPLLVAKGYGPIEAIKASSGLFKRTWGEQFTANFGFGLLMFVGVLVAVLPALAIAAVSPVAGIVVGVFLVAIALGIVTALEGIFKAALYEYAAEDVVGTGFDRADLAGAYRPK